MRQRARPLPGTAGRLGRLSSLVLPLLQDGLSRGRDRARPNLEATELAHDFHGPNDAGVPPMLKREQCVAVIPSVLQHLQPHWRERRWTTDTLTHAGLDSLERLWFQPAPEG